MPAYYESFNSRVSNTGPFDIAESIGGNGTSGAFGDTYYRQIDDGGRGILSIHPATTTTSWTSLWTYSDAIVFYGKRLRAYLFLYGYPASGKYIVLGGGHYSDFMCSLIMDSTGRVAMYHNGTIGTWSSTTVPLSTQIRIEVNGNPTNIKGGVWITDQNSAGAPDIQVDGVTSIGFYLPLIMGSSVGLGALTSPYPGAQYMQGDAVRFDDSTSTNWIGPETQTLLWSPERGTSIATTRVKVNKNATDTVFSPASVKPHITATPSVDRISTAGAVVNKTISVNVGRLTTAGAVKNSTYTTNNGAILGP
jgi:hypothetical protein